MKEGARATLEGRMRAQTESAIISADAILFVIDARVGVTPEDKYFADLVRRADKPVLLLRATWQVAAQADPVAAGTVRVDVSAALRKRLDETCDTCKHRREKEWDGSGHPHCRLHGRKLARPVLCSDIRYCGSWEAKA